MTTRPIGGRAALVILVGLAIAAGGVATLGQDAKTKQANPAQAKPAQGKAGQAKPAQGKPAQGKPAQAKPKPGQEKPAQPKPAQEKPAQEKPAPPPEPKPDEPKAKPDEPAPAPAPPPEAPKPPPAPKGADGKLAFAIVGAQTCAACHTDGAEKQFKAEADAGRLSCRLNEFKTWDENDKHKIAWKALADDRAKEMGRLLGIADVSKANACISCHGLLPPAAGVFTQNYAKPEEEGVTCIACHGDRGDWIQSHAFNTPGWRRLDRKEKEADHGMLDLWDADTRAQRCVSCHVGSAAEGKVVTHAMYAAGHPPLPSIEAATFSDAQPRHWQYLREKKEEIQKRFSYDPAELEQTKLVALSGLVPLRDAMRLFADQAKAGGIVQEPKTAWPDLARFDCTACHHELQSPGWLGWRQVRGFRGDPGRPQAPTWPSALVQIGIEAAGSDQAPARLQAFGERIDAFRRAMSARPFGDTDQAIAAARAVADWADEVVKDANAAKTDRTVALALLRKIVGMGRDELPDYDTARQLFWAFRAISREVQPEPAADAPLPGLLDALDKDFTLTLPAASSQEPIEQTLAPRLKALDAYDAAAFQSRFAALAAHIPAD